jgi:hypothetical protein
MGRITHFMDSKQIEMQSGTQPSRQADRWTSRKIGRERKYDLDS